MMHARFKIGMAWFNVSVFFILLLVGGLAFIFSTKQTVSEAEKRNLKSLPTFSWESVGSGKYLRDLDDYVSDNFIFRYSLTELAGQIKAIRGWNSDDIELFSSTHAATTVASADAEISEINKVPAQETNSEIATPALSPNETSTLADSSASTQNQLTSTPSVLSIDKPPSEKILTSVAQPVTPPPVKPQKITNPATTSSEDLYENIDSIIVYRGQALQIFSGSAQSTEGLAKTINRYREELAPDVSIFFMPIPIGSDFYLPSNVNKGVMREKIAIEHMRSKLDPDIRFVEAYQKLAERTTEYIQFNTDHHWTGLGAYYAYTAFADAAGFDPLRLNEFKKGEIPNFLGTLYQRTMSPTLKKKGDIVEYYKVPVATQASYYPANARNSLPLTLYAEYAREGNAYGVFLGGDFPLMHVLSSVKNSKKIAVIKDSYGNAFAPYLATHYEEVFILDYRYFSGNIKKLIEDNGIQNLLFAHNTYVMAGSYTAQRARGFLTAPLESTPRIIEK
jgi:hypothetical protein